MTSTTGNHLCEYGIHFLLKERMDLFCPVNNPDFPYTDSPDIISGNSQHQHFSFEYWYNYLINKEAFHALCSFPTLPGLHSL